MKRPQKPEDSTVFELGPPLEWVLVDLAASEETGVLRTIRARGPAAIHFQRGKVTRVQAEDYEPLVAYLVRKQMLSAAEMRSAICEIEHLDVTLADAFERLGLMDKLSLDRLRARRTKAALEEIITSGARVFDFETRAADAGPPVDVVEPVVRTLVRAGLAEEWLESHLDLQGGLQETPTLEKLRDVALTFIGEELLPAEGETMSRLLERVGEEGEQTVAALIMVGFLELTELLTESPEHLEERAAALDTSDEACRLLIRASELYEARGDSIEARRASLSALRRRPTAASPLAQVERLCARGHELATLELVYELVNGAMPGCYGRRALLYRAGRIFETEFGDMGRAREYYRRAIGQVAESGAPLDALRRTSLALGDIIAVSDAYMAVGLASSNPAQQKTWLQQAADIAHRAGDEKRAQAILAQAEFIMAPRRTSPVPDEAPSQQEEQPEESADFESFADLADELTDGASSEEDRFDPNGGSGHVELLDEVILTPPPPGPPTSGPESRLHARPTSNERPLEELCAEVALFPSDLTRLEELRARTEGMSGDEPVSGAVASLMSVFGQHEESHPLGSTDTLKPLSEEMIRELATPPDTAEVRALATLWRAASQMITKDLADLGVGRAIPQSSGERSPAADAFDVAKELLPVEPVRLLHMPSGPPARVVLSRPLSLLTGPSGFEDSPDLRFRITKGVTMCHPDLILPCVMGSEDLDILIQATIAAFGQSPPRGSLHFVAASLAQDLWTAVPRATQEELKTLLTDASPTDIDAIRADALAAAHRLALLITGDVAAAIRVATSDDPALSSADVSTESGFAQVVERSEQVADLVRLALWPRYWELRLTSGSRAP